MSIKVQAFKVLPFDRCQEFETGLSFFEDLILKGHRLNMVAIPPGRLPLNKGGLGKVVARQLKFAQLADIVEYDGWPM